MGEGVTRGCGRVPFAKTGGLADVTALCPSTSPRRGGGSRFPAPIQRHTGMYKQQMELVYRFSVHLGWRNQYCGILKLGTRGNLLLCG